ncbi:FxsA family protein [Campylobacter curvus]|uniref:FxsA family protein n=1 Tax=Campylobacter curvus TaxID=200 RepID=UPI00035D07C1|nr:FxsA family protein [Campylobacter curvus]QKF61377.1 FxsA family membrane protein [Campylobacter curvus]UEB49690.1 FxsA family protein [Campylobacter curvus]
MLKLLWTPYIIAELVCLYFFVHRYGFLGFVSEVIISGILGLFLMFRVGFFEITSRMAFIKPSDIFGALGMAIGGFFLFLPGILTDFIGAIVVLLALFAKFRGGEDRAGEDFNSYRYYQSANSSENSDIIDIEVIEEKQDIEDRR